MTVCPACGARWWIDDNGEPTPDYQPLEDFRSERERWLESEIDRLTTSRNDFKLLAAELSNKLYDIRHGDQGERLRDRGIIPSPAVEGGDDAA